MWCQRFSPVVAVEESAQPDCLLLDVTGCSHLFGGEEGLARTAMDAFRDRGLWIKTALADTIGAAWAVAKCQGGGIVPPGKQDEILRPLAVEGLRLPAQALQLLHQFDIHRVGQLLTLPRPALPSRFGREVILRLDQALGHVAELVDPEQAPEPIEASWAFDAPVSDRRVLETVLEQLLDQVLQRLWPRQWGVQQLVCSLTTTQGEGEPLRLQVGLLRPSSSAKHLLELLRLQLEPHAIYRFARENHHAKR